MFNVEREAQKTLNRLRPRIEPLFADQNPEDYQLFLKRLEQHFPRIFELLCRIYGDQYDFFYYLEQILQTTADAFIKRSSDLHKLDAEREADPTWFKNHKMVGGMCYVDRFAGDLAGIHERIPYFKSLGLTYLHLMPLFKAPADNSDGGYAVSDYRQVNPALGTMNELRDLAQALRDAGISLVLDFVFNHTSDEHEWALWALRGEETYQEFYYFFPDRTLPDQYERTLREIFPDNSPGSFTYRSEVNQWVWTTFNHFQWDLNYRNPAVFDAMLGEMLFLANQGVEVLRLDAVAFIWKQMGTSSENLPQAHWLIQAYNALAQVAAPAMLFKSEAIVHPDDVASYISREECPISYNPTFMALLWETLATREVKLLRHSMSHRFQLDPHCTWVNYVRVHDDIGWSFADEDAGQVGINGYDHRQFLNQFYTGRFKGSFAMGLPFQYNPVNQDMRISGTTASLAGLEQAIARQDDHLINHAIKRIVLIHSVILAAGGIPLIYLGDEIASLNDYSYKDNPAIVEDTRWAHRPAFDWERAKKREDAKSVEGRVFQGITQLIQVRKATPTLDDEYTVFFDTFNGHVLGFMRNRALMVLANFSEQRQTLRREVLSSYWSIPEHVIDLATGTPITFNETLALDPYQCLWLADAQSFTPSQTGG